MSKEPITRLLLSEKIQQEMRQIPKKDLNRFRDHLSPVKKGRDKLIGTMDDGLRRLYALHASYVCKVELAGGKGVSKKLDAYEFFLRRMFILALMEHFELWSEQCFTIHKGWKVCKPVDQTFVGSSPITNNGRDAVRGERDNLH